MPNYATDGVLPRDTVGFPAEGLYVPGIGTVAQQGGALTTDSTGQPSAPANVQFGGSTPTLDSGILRLSLQAQATPVTGSAAVAVNTANSAALPAVSAKTNYITGFSVTTQGGASAAAGAVTITGVITGTLTFEVGAAAGSPVQVYVSFPSPIPASAVNTAITVNVPALGATTGAAACTVYGYVQ